MDYKMKRFFIALITPLLLLFSLVSVTVYASGGSATMYLSPATGSYLKGSTLVINIYENSGTDSVNAVQANLSYPTSQLTFSSITSSSAFSIEAESTGSGGLVKIGRGSITARTGPQLVATVRFVASGAGTAPITFASGSSVVRSTDNGSEILTTSGGNYTVTVPVTTSTPPSPTPTSTPTTTKTPTPTTVKKLAALTIFNIRVTNLTDKSATITWQTSVPASSVVSYGFSTKYILSAVSKTLTTTHSVALDPAALVGHQTYHFAVKSIDAQNRVVASQDMTFYTAAISAAPAAPKAAKSSHVSVKLVSSVSVLALVAVAGVLLLRSRGRWHRMVKPTVSDNSNPGTSGLRPGGSITTEDGATVVKPTEKK